MNIFQKMAAISNEISTVAKNLNIDTGKRGGSYKAVGEADVLAAVKPLEEKHGVYSYPRSRMVIDSGELVTKNNDYETRRLYMRIETVYRFVNIEKPDDYLEIVSYGDGVDTQDKAPGKAMTYADKYALLKAYKIQTGDDPDQYGSEDLVKKGKAQIEKPSKYIGEEERMILEAMAQKAGLNVSDIPNYPNITAATYTNCVRQCQQQIERNGNQRTDS